MKNKIITFGFVMILSSFLLAVIVLPDREYSSMENRYLNQKPEFTWKEFLNGEYMKAVEDYLSDQVLFKDALVTIKSDAEKMLAKQESNGVYFGENGYYVKDYNPDQDKYKRNLEFIKEFVDKYKDEYNMAFLLAPNVQGIYDELVPENAAIKDGKEDIKTAKEYLKDISFIDPTWDLKQHDNEYLYFRTDHHWTMRGAYYAYAAICRELGLDAMDISDYDSQMVSDEFYGSLYSKAPLSSVKEDSLEVFFNPKGRYQVVFEDGTKMNSLFARSNLYTKDKYTYFLDGNHSFITIRSNSASGKRALVFKDSYSHALLPFLADNYSSMDVVDLRYYRDNLDELINNGKYDQIFFIYNLDFITSDDNFVWLQG